MRLHPDKASKLFQIPLNGEKIQVIGVEPETTTPAKVDVPVSVTALKALEPMPAIGSLPPEVTGEPVAVAAPVVEAPKPAPVQVSIPQVASVSDPKPVGVHHMSKEMREWRARNPKA